MNWGVELLQSSALPLGYGTLLNTEQRGLCSVIGASDEARTRYLHLGKVALYQMSYTRIWCPGPESNQRHADFQSAALPTELPGQTGCFSKHPMATRKGLEPSTSGVTGRRSNQLNYRAILAGAEGLEPSARGFGDLCSTNRAIPLNIELNEWVSHERAALSFVRELVYHRMLKMSR